MADTRNSNTTRAALAVGAAAIAAGAATLFFRRDQERDGIDSDAPHWTLDKKAHGDRPVIGKTLLINRPRQELFAVWTDFKRFPEFMENVNQVTVEDGGRSIWEIAGPGGTTVTLVNRVTRTIAGEELSWQSEEDSEIANSGKVTFRDAPAGRGTYVSLVLSSDPPGGTVARGIAKLLQREPAIQARRDLRRFKQLMETGEVTVNASPSGRPSESPTEARI